jgi:hypothetical protein
MLLGTKLLLLVVILQVINTAMITEIFYTMYCGWW